MSKLAVIRLRGGIGSHHSIRDTLRHLRLESKNACILIEDTPSVRGMLHKAKDYITFGEVDDAMAKLLYEKKSRPYLGRIKDAKGKEDFSRRFREVNGKKILPFFRLANPRGGFERKGIKVGFNAGGALGDRGKDINRLLEKMINNDDIHGNEIISNKGPK